ncbi:MAG: 6-bladed beta-propeller [Fodinibius sp.]|nr:6-bladed beta-propeller [Fodinibius sp.]
MTKNNSINNVEVSELEDSETFISSSEAILGIPVSLELSRDSLLHVYDKGTGTVVRMNSDGKVISEFGGRGQGPGEFLQVNNMVIPNNHGYIVDGVQYRISKFSSGGVLKGTYKFGKGMGMPPPPPSSKTPRALDIYNEPSITKNGNVLRSAFGPEGTSNYLYQLLNWEGKQISRIGHVPEGSKSKFNSDRYLEAISNQKIPPYHKPNSFPINDQATQDEIYLVYSSYPKIAKYDTTGAKLWEEDSPNSRGRLSYNNVL